MFFSCAAAVAAAATHSPAWFLSGAYHPPLPGRASDDSLHNVIGSDDKEMGSEISGEALTVALDVVQAWAVLLTLGFTLIIFFFLAFCVCSKKDDGYDEFEISQGITTVKICHDGGENGVSLIPRINGSGTESLKATDETSEASSRYTLKRELPAIPTTASGHDISKGRMDRPVSQHSSDFYASVNETGQGNASIKLIGGVQVLPAGAVAPGGRAAVVKESVSSPGADRVDGGQQEKKDPAELKKEEKHVFSAPKKTEPISLVSKVEHPYAKVGPTSTRKESEKTTDSETYSESKGPIKDTRKRESETHYESAGLPETKKKDKFLPLSSHLGDTSAKVEAVPKKTPSPNTASFPLSTAPLHPASGPGRSPISPNYRSPTSPPQSEPPAPIPAAMAISGRTPANEEMPYMTPPALQPNRDQTQQHFSGDSQDSRGYTSISVREPLAALKARQAAEGTGAGRNSGKPGFPGQGPEGEGYYMTVSDDSADEMYACIYEGSRGTGSETYAQIEPRLTPLQEPPSTLSASNLPPASSPTGLSGKSPPAPPSVDSLRHVVHSRQASAGSSTSTGMGSPVAEKRGTRSPLPPLPQGDTVLYSPPEPPILPSQPIPKSPPKSIGTATDKPSPRSLEEMYAKVLKKPPGHSRGSSSGAVEGSSEIHGIIGSTRRGSAEFGPGKWTSTSPTSKPCQDMTHSLVETRTHDVVSGVNRAKSCDVSSAWGGGLGTDERKTKTQIGRNYETISSLYSGSDPGYETVKNGEPPYASVDSSANYPGYETVQGSSDVDSEPGYETLKHKEFEPGYETVSEIVGKKSSRQEPGYESVTTEYEPGYETVSSKKPSDPGYESVLEKTKHEYDPGYEELSHPSHVRTISETDPNYEQLKFSSRRSSGEGDNGYEVVNKGLVEGNYETVSDFDSQARSPMKPETSPVEQKSSVMPLYASVKKKEKQEPTSPQDVAPVPVTKNENFNVIETSPIAPIPPLDLITSPSGDAPTSKKVMVDIIRKPILQTQAVVEESSDEVTTNGDASTKEDVSSKDEWSMKEEVVTKDDVGVKEEDISTKDDPSMNSVATKDGIVTKDDTTKDDVAMDDVIAKDVPLKDEVGAKEAGVMKDEDKLVSVEESTKKEDSNQKYPVMDSPEEVELPPPGEDDNHRVSPPTLAEELESLGEESRGVVSSTLSPQGGQDEQQPTVSLTFTAASPPDGSPETSSARSSESSDPSEKEGSTPAPKGEEGVVPGTISSVPPQFEDPKPDSGSVLNSMDDPLPPPPLPSLDDDGVTASPPPPPPPPVPEGVCNLIDLPPPPLPPAKDESPEVNGVSSPIEAVPSSPPPPGVEPVSCSELPPPPLPCGEESSGDADLLAKTNCINGSITVTVNPMAEMEDGGDTGVPPIPHSIPSADPISPGHPAPPLAPASSVGESVESQSSGSTVNGSGSVESVVTVDPKSGGDPATTVPGQSPLTSPLQHSSSTSSSDSKQSDPNEGITPV